MAIFSKSKRWETRFSTPIRQSSTAPTNPRHGWLYSANRRDGRRGFQRQFDSRPRHPQTPDMDGYIQQIEEMGDEVFNANSTVVHGTHKPPTWMAIFSKSKRWETRFSTPIRQSSTAPTNPRPMPFPAWSLIWTNKSRRGRNIPGGGRIMRTTISITSIPEMPSSTKLERFYG